MRHRTERAHVVQPVGELHQNHADVACHREQHLAEVFRLRLFAIAKLHFVQLRQPVDQFRDLRAESLGEFGLGHALVFHHVVQQRRHDRLGVEIPAGADFRDGDRMGNVGFAALPILAEVGFVAEMERRLDVLDLFRLQIAGQSGGQFGDRNDVMPARLLRRGGRPEQMAKRLFEDRVDILPCGRGRVSVVFHFRGGGRGRTHVRLRSG